MMNLISNFKKFYIYFRDSNEEDEDKNLSSRYVSFVNYHYKQVSKRKPIFIRKSAIDNEK